MERDEKGRFLKGKSASLKTQFKEGHSPWNKELKGYKNKTGNYNKKSGFQKGHENYHQVGNIWNKESRIKLSLAQTGEKEFTGFKREIRGRIMNMGKYLEWRSAVFKRDNYHCQNCSEKGYIEAHHIIPFSKIIKMFNIKTTQDARNCKELWDIGNGITYCRACHILLDNQIGKRGKSKQEQLNDTGGKIKSQDRII